MFSRIILMIQSPIIYYNNNIMLNNRNGKRRAILYLSETNFVILMRYIDK